MMRFDILTLFPEMFRPVLDSSIIGRAQQNGIIEINIINIRDFSADKHRKTDDYPYGGGSGMVMMPQPIYDAFKSIAFKEGCTQKVLYMSPQGKPLKQQMVKELSSYDHLVILCGHYEGIDERVLEDIVDEEISIGDYVLTGGELPAMVLIDSVCRAIPGVLSAEESYSIESHWNGLLEYPQYTRPYEFNGKRVPDILMSGHHANIEKWRKQQSLIRTYIKRPDLFNNYKMTDEERELFEEGIKTIKEQGADILR